MPEEKHPEKEKIFSITEPQEDQQPKEFKDRFMDTYFNIAPYFNINLAWYLLSIPVITFFPALGGLYYALLKIEDDNYADWGTVWEGFKKYWWLSLRWGLLVLLGDIILFANIWFCLNIEQQWSNYALLVTLVITIIWFAINQFSFPLLLLQGEKKILLAIRNGYVIVMRRPAAAIKVLVLTLLIAVVSILLPPLWIFITMAFIAKIRTQTVIRSINKLREKDAARDAIRAHREGHNTAQAQKKENHSDLS